MAEEDIPPEVKNFLADHIDSVLQLETLLLLRAKPEVLWTTQAVSREVRIDEAWAAAQLANFASAGILSVESNQYRFAPRTTELRDVISLLAASYAARRVTIIGLIFAKPPTPLRSFADAFRLRKDKKDG